MNPRWLVIAERELRTGVAEIPGPADSPRIVAYHARTSLPSEYAREDETPWCSSFANYCVTEAGYDSIEVTGSARARSWLVWGVGVAAEEPPYGAIVVLARGRGPQPGPEVLNAPGHVGFFFGFASDDEILVLGGNQGDAVTVLPYPMGRVLGYRWAA